MCGVTVDHRTPLEMPLTTKCAAGPGLMAIRPVVPVMLLVTESTAVKVCIPAVYNRALNVPTPLVNTLSPGRTAAPSVLVK